MSINNIAIHHTNRISGQNSIAASCLNRLELGRELKVAPGYCIKKNSRTYHCFDYSDIMGNPCKRVDLANLYGVAGKTISSAYERNNGNAVLANIDLMRRLKR